MPYYKKKNLLQLERKRAGLTRDAGHGIFLDRNERAVQYSSKIINLLYKDLSKINLSLYPEVDTFYKKLSNWLGVDTDQLFITEGVSGAIKAIIETLTIPRKNNIIFPYPTFALYPVYCQMFSVQSKFIGYLKNYNLDFDQLIESIDDETAVVFLPNPNMPIEGYMNIDKIRLVAEKCLKNNVMLVLDEVYYPFGGKSGIELINDYNNILIMRSFSKAFGLAGIRLGYVIGSNENINYISKTRTGYETNSISQAVATFFIDNYNVIDEYINEVKLGLNYLKEKLQQSNIEFASGEAGNFLFINLKDRKLSEGIVQFLNKKNIYIRGGWPKPFDQGFSVTGAPISTMKIFYNSFIEGLKVFK